MENKQTTFGERLEFFIKIAEFSKAEYAESVGVNPNTVTNYLNDRTSPPLSVLRATYQMGCNLNWLITGDGSVYADNFMGSIVARKTDGEEMVTDEMSRKYENAKRKALESLDDEAIGQLMRRFFYNMVLTVDHLENEPQMKRRIGHFLNGNLENNFDPFAPPPPTLNEERENYRIQRLQESEWKKLEEYRYSLVRSWLTETGSIEEWYLKCKEALPNITFNEVMALEGHAFVEYNHETQTALYEWLGKNGISVDWLLGLSEDANEPFRNTPEGEKLRKKVFAASASAAFARNIPDKTSDQNRFQIEVGTREMEVFPNFIGDGQERGLVVLDEKQSLILFDNQTQKEIAMNVNAIVFCQAVSDFTIVHINENFFSSQDTLEITKDRIIVEPRKLNDIAHLLPWLIRCHRSFLVNPKYVLGMSTDEDHILLRGSNVQIDVARGSLIEVKRLLRENGITA